MVTRRWALAGVVAGLAGCALVTAPAMAKRNSSKQALDQDQVLAAVQRGEMKPLAAVLEVVAKAVPGPVIEVEVERKHGRLVYELKIITERGRVREVYVDASTLEILKIE